MAIRVYKPTTAGRRNASVSDFSELTRSTPEKSLVRKKSKTGGRNSYGRITSRHRGGGHKRQYRLIDFKRWDKDGVPAKVAEIEYDPNRSARIALLHFADGEKRYIIAPKGIKQGDVIETGAQADIKPGNNLPLKNIPTGTVVHLLENREYTGCLVNFKTEKPSYKLKHSIENPPEKQAVFENHHEPIIDRETWERVQELRKQRKRPNRYDEVGLFSGILFCADCGSVMYQQRYQTDKRKQDCYICGSYKKRTADCTAHFIRTDLLTAGVLSNLRKVTSYAAKHEARFMKLLIEQNEDGGKRRNAAKKKELEAAEKRIAELSAIFKRLYEDSVTGRISDERFTELSADYEAEQRELKERAAAIQAELSKAQEATVNAEKFMNVVRRHTSFEELTPTLLREFVEKIVVHECSYDENKTRRQDIEIYYSFVGKVDLPE